MEQTHVTYINLPWFDPAGELNYSCMTLGTVGEPDARMVRRSIRKWYKESLGVTMDKSAMRKLWASRMTTPKFNAEKYLHEKAMETYEQTKEITDTSVQERTA